MGVNQLLALDHRAYRQELRAALGHALRGHLQQAGDQAPQRHAHLRRPAPQLVAAPVGHGQAQRHALGRKAGRLTRAVTGLGPIWPRIKGDTGVYGLHTSLETIDFKAFFRLKAHLESRLQAVYHLHEHWQRAQLPRGAEAHEPRQHAAPREGSPRQRVATLTTPWHELSLLQQLINTWISCIYPA